MRICMVGASGHNGYVLSGIVDPLEDRIVGVAPGSVGEDTSKLAKQCHARDHAPKEYQDYQHMLDELAPEVVTVAPHFCDNATVACEALWRGMHVFVEKPIATTFDDLGRLREGHARSDRLLAAMFGLRYDPAMLAAWRAVKDGQVGEPRLITAQKSYKLGSRPAFYRKRDTYGGTIPWVGIHAIDLVRWFAGVEFVSVAAAHSTMHNSDHEELEVSALCQFKLEDDVFASTSIDYLRPATAETHGDDRIRVAGTAGVVEVRGGAAFLTHDAAGGTKVLEPVEGRRIFADFLAQAKGDGECLISAEDSFRATEAALFARQAADEGAEIRFGPAPYSHRPHPPGQE